MVKYFFLSLSIIHSLLIYAQECDLRFDQITTKDGLSTSWVNAIYEDKNGFMWFGTSDGLNRYDAYSTRIYWPSDEEDLNPINGAINHLMGINEDKLLLICSDQGVGVFDLQKEEFQPFPHLDKARVTHALADSGGKIWFTSSSGLFCFNSSDSTMKAYKHDPMDETSLGHNELTMCYIDKRNDFWIGTYNGLDRFDRQSNSFQHFFRDKEQQNTYMVNSIIEDDSERLWVGVQKKGLYVLLRNDDLITEDSFDHILDGSVSKLVIDGQNTLWIGNDLNLGIYRIPLDQFHSKFNFTVQPCKGIPGKFMSLSDNTISDIYQDRSGSMWFGTFAGGVNYYNPVMKQFYNIHHMPGNTKSLINSVVNCFVDDDVYLWIGTEEGLSRYNKKTFEFTNFFHQPGNPKSLSQNGVLSMIKDSRGNLWVGTWLGGLNLYNPSGNNFTRFQSDQTKPGSIRSNNIIAMLEDSKGNFWVGTDGGGLNLFNYTTRKFSSFLPDPDDSSSIFHDAVNDICETSDGELYLLVYHSLELFDYKTQSFKHFTHNKNDSTSIGPGLLNDIFEDSRSNLWIASSSGLNYFNREKGSFHRYTQKHGLPGNTVLSILEDNSGNLWLGTNKGIVKFLNATQLPEKPVFITYTSHDGLIGNEFIRRSALKTSDGNLFFGGSKYYVHFHPDSIFRNTIQPEVVLTGFGLFGTTNDRFEEWKILGKEINQVEKIELNYDQSDFEIRFSLLNYLNPEKNKYSYILEGYEKEWRSTGSERTATYTNINPGKYVFRVRGANNDGVWSANEKTVEIIIKHAWWGKPIVKLGVILVFAILILIIIRIRLRIYKNQKQLLEDMVMERTTELSEVNAILEEKQEEISIQNDELTKHRSNLEKLVNDRTEAMKQALKRAEEADRLKSAFLANMSHEIRTPMNAIVGFATLLANEELSGEEQAEYVEIITNNSETLMVLINDILEISLIEANQLRLNKSNFNVTKILTELDSYYRLRNNKEIELVFVNKTDKKDIYLHTDQTRFRQIFTNLLNNAFKYTELGKISFGYELEEKEIKFFVIDSGIGIAVEEYDNIFNYFHKIDKGDNKLYRGAGIGLSISNKLVELMGGKIWLESTVGKGTSFFFTMPSDDIFDNRTELDAIDSRQQNNLKGVTIVVAEDETTNYKLVEKILKPTQATIIWAENGREAVDKVNALKTTKNCVVLMDIKMPLLNGINATKIIKETHPELPVIAVTAYAQSKDKDQILKQSFIDYIAKPLKPEQLLLKIYKYAFINQ